MFCISSQNKDDHLDEFLSSLGDPSSPLIEDFDFTSGKDPFHFFFFIAALFCVMGFFRKFIQLSVTSFVTFSLDLNSRITAFPVTQQVFVLKRNLFLLPRRIHPVLLYQVHQRIRYYIQRFYTSSICITNCNPY